MSVKTQSFLEVFRDINAPVVLEDGITSHRDIPTDLVWIAVWGGLHIFGCLTNEQKKELVVAMLEMGGPDIYASTHPRLLVTNKASVTLNQLVYGLSRARVESVVLVEFKMKRKIALMDYLSKLELTSVCRSRWDIGFEVQGNRVISLHSEHGTVHPMYVILGNGGGSVKIDTEHYGIPVIVKCYPVVLHALKNLGKLSWGVPQYVKNG